MKLYDLITEATACDNWKNNTFVNGDGKKTPKITIEKTETMVTGTYEGPESGFCIQSSEGNPKDSVHQLAGITVFYECNPYLKVLYKGGTYVRPNLKGVTLERKKNYYKISIPLEKTTEDKAITSINQRGSWGGGEGGIEATEFNSAKTRPMFYTETLISTGLSDMTEYFFCWRNLQDYPIKTASNKEVVNKTEEPKKEVVKKTEEPKKEEPKKQLTRPNPKGPVIMVGGYFVRKTGPGQVVFGLKVFSSSPGDAMVMLYDVDGKPLFKENQSAITYSTDGPDAGDGELAIAINNVLYRIVQF